MTRSCSARRQWAAAGLLAAAGLGPAAADGVGPEGRLAYAGRPLAEVVAAAGPRYGLRFGVPRSVAAQRVTAYSSNCTAREFTEGLAQLLSPSDDARWTWTRQGANWTLKVPQNWTALGEQLRSQSRARYAAFLEAELDYARRQQVANRPDGAAAPRLSEARVLEAAGAGGLERLLQGRAVVIRLRAQPEERRKRLAAYLRGWSGRAAGAADAELDRYSLVLLLSLHPTDAAGSYVGVTRVDENGFAGGRAGILAMPNPRIPHFIRPPLQLPTPSGRETGPKVDVVLTPAAARGKGRTTLAYDECLRLISQAAGVTVLSDGYLRPPVPAPPGLKASSYPLELLLGLVSRTWGVTWRYAEGRRRAVLLRARDWWLEDAADVPDGIIQALPHVDLTRVDAFDVLTPLAELREAQLHKLIEAELLPEAWGLVLPMWHDDAGVRPILRFLARLPKGLAARARQPAGLRLGDAPPDLVREWLTNTLFANVGAVDPERWGDLVLSLRAAATRRGLPALEVRIRSPQSPGSNWWRQVERSPFASTAAPRPPRAE
jgi:hypothetical protein